MRLVILKFGDFKMSGEQPDSAGESKMAAN